MRKTTSAKDTFVINSLRNDGNMTIVNCRTPFPLKLRVIDMTHNKKGWEYDTSAKVYKELKSRGIPISGEMETPKSIKDLELSLDGDFSALLIFAHGAKSEDAITADELSITGNWFLFSKLNVDLSDKFVSLCICEGFCQDMIDSLIKGDLFALTVMASRQEIGEDEGFRFFPVFYEILAGRTTSYIDPNDVRDCMNIANSLAENKMQVYSDCLSE